MLNKKRKRYKQSAAILAAKHNEKINLDSWEEIWALLEKYKEPEYLYMIGEAFGTTVKIGKSRNPGQRLKQLQTGYPNELKLYAYCPHESPFTEKEVHQVFKKYKLEGEWFQYNEDIFLLSQRMKKCAGL